MDHVKTSDVVIDNIPAISKMVDENRHTEALLYYAQLIQHKNAALALEGCFKVQLAELCVRDDLGSIVARWRANLKTYTANNLPRLRKVFIPCL